MNDRNYSLDDLLHLMARLRNPGTGCPWDLQQDFHSLVPYVLEEAYEVADTIERNDFNHLAEELGDLLFQVVFHARLADERGLFAFGDIVHKLTAKLVARHPHVFPDGALASERSADDAISAGDIGTAWEARKQNERRKKGHRSVLADVPAALPALVRAQKIQKRAAKVGFDWSNVAGVIRKIEEEISELQAELGNRDRDRLEDELGDVLFSLVNLSRHLNLDAETALRRATGKFEKRFSLMERLMDEADSTPEELSTQALDRFWERAKAVE